VAASTSKEAVKVATVRSDAEDDEDAEDADVAADHNAQTNAGGGVDVMTPCPLDPTDVPTQQQQTAAEVTAAGKSAPQINPLLPSTIEEVVDAAVDLSLNSTALPQIQRIAVDEIKQVVGQKFVDLDLPSHTAEQLQRLATPKIIDGMHHAVGAQMDIWMRDKLHSEMEGHANGIFDNKAKQLAATEKLAIECIDDVADAQMAQDLHLLQEQMSTMMAAARTELTQQFEASLQEARSVASTAQNDVAMIADPSASFDAMCRDSAQELETMTGTATGLLNRTPNLDATDSRSQALEDLGIEQRSQLTMLGNAAKQDLTASRITLPMMLLCCCRWMQQSIWPKIWTS